MNITIEKNLMVPMRDGIRLATDVYRPAEEGAFPTLLQRLPYSKDITPVANYSLDILTAVQAGFTVIVQDTRGCFASDGRFDAYVHEADDGADTIEWASRQAWSTGSVAMFGGSYFGVTQWLAASATPPALVAIAPAMTTDQLYDGWTYLGGALQLGFILHWAGASLGIGQIVRNLGRGNATIADLTQLVADVDSLPERSWRLPLAHAPEFDAVLPDYQVWLAHPSYDDYWRDSAVREKYDKVAVPALNIGGWYDLFLRGTIANYLQMQSSGASEAARRGQRLLIGPWAHASLNGEFPERSFGMMSGTIASGLTQTQLEWFHAVMDKGGAVTDLAKPVRIFHLGPNVWRDESSWPLPDTDYVDFHFTSRAGANGSAGDGRLLESPPVLDFGAPGSADTFTYDPRDPVPTIGGATYLPGMTVAANAGPRDRSVLDGREDVLFYTGGVLETDLDVIGPVNAVIHMSSTAVDTDIVAVLVDVGPDGRAEAVCDGILRLRYRESLESPVLMEPGVVYELKIDMAATAYRFFAGHHIRVEITSSNFPRFDRNSNSGGVIATESVDDFVSAVNTVHHSADCPSRLILPVVP